jgi:exodeoxyribonuclease-3
VRLATWNVNSILPRLPRLKEWLGSVSPDVVCLQETKCDSEAFPRAELSALGYEAAAYGDGRWNGVAVLSRIGIEAVVTGLSGEPGSPETDARQARAIGATCGSLRVWSVYVPNGRALDSPHYDYKLRWLAALRETVAGELAGQARALVVCGDFNVAPTDTDLWDPVAFIGATHVTVPERRAVAALRALGLTDVIPRPLKGNNPFTYWDYRAGMFHKDMGMRIDHVYATPAVADAVRDAYIDREARKGKLPSDHAPVVVDFDG